MRTLLVETGKTFLWQKRLLCSADAVLNLGHPGCKYMCSTETFSSLAARLENFSADLVYLGSGSYHHLALSLISRKAWRGPLCVLVFDQHLDCLAAPKGYVTCGSWIQEAVKIPGVQKIVVVGVSEKKWDVPPKVTVVTAAGWQRCWCRPEWQKVLLPAENLYISIDKDAFAGASTDWGTGKLALGEVFSFLRRCLFGRRLVGADICGDIEPREPWPAWEEAGIIARHEKINLAFLQFFRRLGRPLFQRAKGIEK